MKDNHKIAESNRKVGDRVGVHQADDAPVTGELIEDFAAYLVRDDELGRDWAPPRRWAVALDAGTLVFADDEDLTDLPGPSAAPADPT